MSSRSPGASDRRRNRLLQELVHDPYQAKNKLPEPCVCPVCNAVFTRGRWQWAESWPADSQKHICQACCRIRDNYPAGVIALTGAFAEAHKAELINLARNEERAEISEHALHRILRIEEHPGTVIVKTTDVHLPRRIADAVHHAYKGELHVTYDPEGYLFRAIWRRNN